MFKWLVLNFYSTREGKELLNDVDSWPITMKVGRRGTIYCDPEEIWDKTKGERKKMSELFSKIKEK